LLLTAAGSSQEDGELIVDVRGRVPSWWKTAAAHVRMEKAALHTHQR
jgi:hypothetical protein